MYPDKMFALNTMEKNIEARKESRKKISQKNAKKPWSIWANFDEDFLWRLNKEILMTP